MILIQLGLIKDDVRKKDRKVFKNSIFIPNYVVRDIFDFERIGGGLFVVLYCLYKGIKNEN